MSKITKSLGLSALLCLLGFLVAMVVGASGQACFGLFLVFLVLVALTTVHYCGIDNDENTEALRDANKRLSDALDQAHRDLRAEQMKRSK